MEHRQTSQRGEQTEPPASEGVSNGDCARPDAPVSPDRGRARWPSTPGYHRALTRQTLNQSRRRRRRPGGVVRRIRQEAEDRKCRLIVAWIGRSNHRLYRPIRSSSSWSQLQPTEPVTIRDCNDLPVCPPAISFEAKTARREFLPKSWCSDS